MSLTHQQIDRRSLAFDRIIVYLIDHDPERRGLVAAKNNLKKWMRQDPGEKALQQWQEILQKPWREIRKYLLTTSEQMQFLRQSSPFAGPVCIPEDIRMRIICKSYEKADREKSKADNK